MRKWAIGICALSLVAVGLPAMADNGDFEFETEGQVRARLDWFDNYSDLNDDVDDSVSLWPFRANIGLTGSFNEMFWGYVEFQAAGYFGDFNTGLQTYPGNFPVENDVNLYQAYVQLDTDTWDFRFGRAEHEMGNELIMGNNSFYNGQVFDGIRATGDYESWKLDLFVYKLFESQAFGPFISSGTQDDDINFYGVDATIDFGESMLQPYLVHLQDDVNGAGRTSVSTLGALWKRPTVDNDGWDLSLEGAIQDGELGDDSTGTFDTKGYIFEGWFGWTFGSAGRVHVGALWASGDDGSDPTQTDAWTPLFEDGHAYNRAGNLDLIGSGLPGPGCGGLPGSSPAGGTGCLSNIRDISVGYTWGPSAESAHGFYAALHKLDLAEDALAVDGDLGTELDVTYSYEVVKNSNLQVGAGFLSAGDAFGNNADDIMRVWVQLESSWGKAKPWTSMGQQPGWAN